MSSKFNLIIKSSSFRILQTLVNIIIGILMMPFLISTLGQELYGLWIVIGSIVGSYYLLDLGFNQAVTRYVSKYIHQNNPEGANRIINSALVIYTCLGSIVLVVSILAAHFGAERLMNGTEHLDLVKTILIITGLSLAIEFPSKAFPGIISAYMRYDFLAIVRLVRSLIDALLIYFFISNGYGLVAMAVIALCTSLISTIIYVFFTTSLFKGLRFSKNLVDIATFKDVFNFSKWVFVLDVNALLRDKMDIWFIAFYQSSAVLTIYYVAIRLTDYAINFLNQATGFSNPIFTEYYAKNNFIKLKQTLVLFIKVGFLLGGIFIAGFVLVGESFIRLWMGNKFPYHQAYLCLLFLAMGRFLVYFSAPMQSMLLTFNRHNLGAWMSLAETMVSVILLTFMTPKYGILGAALSMSLPLIVSRLIILPLIISRILDLSILPLFKNVTAFVFSSGVFIIFCWELFPLLKELSLIELVVATPFVAIMQLILGYVLFSKDEKSLLKGLMLNKFKGKKI